MPEWVRHEVATRWCSVLRRDRGAIRTRCRGSLDECEPHAIADRPAVADRCVPCQIAYVAAELDALAAGDARQTEDRVDRAALATLRDQGPRRYGYIANADYVPGEDW
jgi:hypothetical protein